MDFIPATEPLQPGTASAWCLAFVEGKLLLPGGDAAALVPLAQPLPFAEPERHYLGRLGGIDCWALAAQAEPAGWSGVPLRAAMLAFPEPLLALASRAAQVLEWDRAHRYCGVCGTPTERLAGERARRCPACRHSVYPRINPAMMALVWRRGEVLLARSPHYAAGMYSALAGFVEAGESIEHCLHREVAEEVGVRVKNLQYYGSQSWPFPHSLMIAYRAEWDGGEIVPQDGEIEDARWFAIDALPKIPPRFSIAGHLIRDTIELLAGGAPDAG
jgi:NAD+ diphosphatase